MSLFEKIAFMVLATLMTNLSDVHSQTAFEYKEVYMQSDNVMLSHNVKLNDLNRDWGIWGHNLHKAIGKQLPQSAFALVNNVRNDEQLCFSSEAVYHKIVDYIHSSYGDNGHVKFSIMPFDNAYVCTCERCKAIGNTSNNAEPAITALVRRLCEAFPNHNFFTSYYLSTAFVPHKELPKNAGVILSTMNWPLRWGENKKEKDFCQLIEEWKRVTDNIYVWDYVSNFDDYFTPFPSFAILQHRLQLYKREGIKGVFLNGSGEDYSSFGDLRYYVLSSLLDNPAKDWKQLINEFYKKHYPVSGEILSDYCIRLEEKCKERAKPLNIYSGVSDAVKSYLDIDDFVKFYDKISMMNKNIIGTEHARLDKLICALSLTRLEICRISSDLSLSSNALTQLAKISKNYGINHYNESGWDVQDYIRDFKGLANGSKQTKNILSRVRFKALSPLDEDYSDTRILTDGSDAIASNYHCGWMISTLGDELDLYAEIPNNNYEGSKIEISFLQDKKMKFFTPEKIEIWSSGKLVGMVTPKITEFPKPYKEVVAIPLNIKVADNLTIKCKRNSSKGKKMALGEIRMFENK